MLSVLSLALTVLLQQPEPRRQFDFWIGEWKVQNRHMDSSGGWSDGDRTRARISPVLDGAAILEEWAGPFGESFMNGFSLRAWNPEREQWTLLLFWTTDGNATFGRLNGSFRHGRGEFFAPESGPRQTRYSFSDALANSVRWDSSVTEDGGLHWKTDWIMEFSRSRKPDESHEVTEERLFAEHWTQGDVSPHKEARDLDWLIGEWEGTLEESNGKKLEARLHSKLLSKGCLLLDLFETRAPGEQDWSGRLAIRGYVSSAKRWEGWSLSEDDTVLRPHEVEPSKRGVRFTHKARGAKTIEEELSLDQDGFLTIERSIGGKRVSHVKLARRSD